MGPLNNYQPERIIIRMPNWIGDLVMATPILTDLRTAYPEAHLTAMCRIPVSDLLRGDQEIDELFCFSKTKRFMRRSGKRDLVEKIKQGKYDLGILLPHSFSSAWLFWLAGVKRRLGYEGHWRGILLTDTCALPQQVHNQHLVDTYKMLLTPLGIPLSSTKPRLFLSDAELEQAQTVLKQFGISSKQSIVGINPGAAYGSAKCWLPERFEEVTRYLLKQGNIQVVYFGDQTSIPLVKRICHNLPSSVVNLAGSTSIRELLALIKHCNVLLTNDSGPMHIAAALGTPVVALFGSTNEIITGPYKTEGVIHKHVSCSPCYQRICPLDFQCMKQIETDEVCQAIVTLLSKTPQNP